MWSIHSACQKPLFLLVSLAALLTFVHAACGGTGSGRFYAHADTHDRAGIWHCSWVPE